MRSADRWLVAGGPRGQAVAAHDAVATLRRTELFGSLGASALRAVASQLEPVDLPAGALVFEEGDPGDALYLVVRGRLRVFHPDGEHPLTLNEIGPGEVVGELAVISDRPRFASVRAVRDSRLLRLSRSSFHDVVASRPKALLDLVRLLVDRVASPALAGGTAVRTVTLIPAGQTDPRLVRSVARALARSLRPFGSVALVGPDDPAAAGDVTVLEAGLDAIEQRADIVLLSTAPERTPWTMGCVRQADRVLLVADVHADTAPSAAEGAIGLAHRDLVLVHPAGSSSLTGTARWLTLRDVRTHHQVRARAQADCDRLARSLMGRSVGVVLSGGGPRGFAHLGAIKALQEAGIPIDAVGGSSIGALMCAGVAFGWEHEATIERVSRALSDRGALLRPTLPLVSLSSGRRVEHLLRSPDYLGDRAMEDAIVPWFCVSTSLRRALIVVHDRGPAWLAVRSSFALPGILPPVYDDGDLLVDGGVLDNLPVDVMRQRLDGSVVAVDLEPEDEERAHAPFDPSVSGWQVLAKRLNPFARSSAAPSALRVLLRSKQVGVRHLQTAVLAAHPVELYLRPPLAALGALDFRSGSTLVDAGYRYTSDLLAQTDLSSFLPPAR